VLFDWNQAMPQSRDAGDGIGAFLARSPRSRDAQFDHTAGITAAPEVMIKVRRQAHLCRSTRSVGDDRLSS
jgi:hypothetical protein